MKRDTPKDLAASVRYRLLELARQSDRPLNWTLSRQYTFGGKTLADAISRTFANRGTELIAKPIALTSAFAQEPGKEAQWRAFLRKTRLEGVELSRVIEVLAQFLGPISGALSTGRSFQGTWKPSGPWRP